MVAAGVAAWLQVALFWVTQFFDVVFFHRLQLMQIESKVQIPRQLNRALFSVLRPIPNEGKALRV